MKKKTFAIILALVLAFGAVIGGTIAYITATTDDVINTFTVGDINIELKEHEINADGALTTDETTAINTYKIIPGTDLNKDPFLRVKAESEACWVFVKITEENWSTKLTYTVDDGWTELTSAAGTGFKVYYKEQAATTADVELNILANKKIVVSSELTKTELEAMKTAAPKLTFTGYAIQKENVADAATAWAALNPSTGD